MSNPFDVEGALRASLQRQARRVPAGTVLAERIIAEAERSPAVDRAPLRHPRWRTWALPLIAAGSVAAVVAAVVGVGHWSHRADHERPVGPATAVVTTPAPSPSTTPAPKLSAVPTPPPVTRALPPLVVAGVTGFQVIDLTFVGPDDGWALAYADCLDNPGQACTAMARTTDGGAHWQSVPPPPVNLPMLTCDVSCAQHIRFANDKVGYVFGPSTLFMTTDGGAHWSRQPGGADALESLDGNVIRVVSDHSGCPGPCNVRVELAAIGATTWKPVRLPGGELNTGQVRLARTGSRAVLETDARSAAARPSVRLFVSSDDGRTWTERTDPCPDAGATFAAADLSSADDGSVSLLCTPSGGSTTTGDGVVVTSRDGGATFAPGRAASFDCCSVGPLAAASADTLLLVGGSTPVRSIDGGLIWSPVIGSGPLVSNVNFAGFENALVGRLVTDGGHVIWTTRNGGATWTGQAFQ